MLAMTDAYVQSKSMMEAENRNRAYQYDIMAAPPQQPLRCCRGSTESFAAHLNEFVSNDAGGFDAVVPQINNDIVSFDENKVYTV